MMRAMADLQPYFLDTSALIKHYLKESGSDYVDHLCSEVNQTNIIMLAHITLVEIVATLHRAAVATPKRIKAKQRDILLQGFQQHVQTKYAVFVMSEAVIVNAQKVCARHHLRAMDALQLASALLIRDELPHASLPPIFVASDQELLNAAAKEGLQVVDPKKEIGNP